jgi:GT2 family glycosyltransferase
VGETAACGGDSLMRVAAYRQVGGFDAGVVAGEEPELCRRIRSAGWRVWRLDAPMTIHDAAMLRLGQWWRRAVRGGFGYAQVWHVRRLYGRELARALLWAVALPLVAVGLALAVTPWALLLLALPLLQIARMALRDGGSGFAWRRAALTMIGKLAEVQGAWRYLWQARSTRVQAPRSYK